MKTLKRPIAVAELLLVLPAVLFMSSLFARNVQPADYEPAHTAWRVVEWFSARPFLGLDVCLIALPLAALGIGFASLAQSWRKDEELRRATQETLAVARSHMATLVIAGATLVAGSILAIVAVHVITD